MTFVLLREPRKADWRPKARAPKPNFFVECPASWLLQRAEAKGSVNAARSVRVHRSVSGEH